ncbi:hypothetical protein [Polyangium aurulentum]|uniref:hypothetical protein n=1 Tax=Polyangium aurulentum TaxID=2567896 RepID=UPI0010ADD5F0|nr:hypothetical protein [Polyangium aurulentum]UQA58154.1 hypothetical protein E8A73_044030 [Polyangium aurulentum]
MKRRRWASSLAAYVAWASFLRAAWALPEEPTEPAKLPARLVLERPGCAPLPFDEAALVRHLHVELAEDGVAASLADPEIAGDPGGPPEARLLLVGACSGGEMTAVLLSSAGGRAERSIDVGSVRGSLRERTLALALAELLRARWADIAAIHGDPLPQTPARPPANSSPPEIPAPDRPASPLPSRIEPAPRARPPLFLSAGVEWRFLFQRNAALTGGRLAASIPLSSRWLGRISAEGAVVVDGDAGKESETSLWLYTGGLGLSAGHSWGDAELSAGPRIEVGWCDARFRELAPEADDIGAGGLVAIASAVAGGRVALVPRLWISLDLEIGYVLRSLESPVAERPSLGLGGLLGSGRLGLALAL